MLPQATQSLTKTGLIRRSATCPVHDKQSSLMLSGTQPDFEGRVYWVFVCKEKGRHTFNALPDRSAPSTTEGYTEWRLEQKAKLAGVKLEKQLQ